MPGAVLHDRVTGMQGHLGAVVELEHDRALEHHFEVDGVGGVHAGIRRVHVAHQPGKLALHVRQRLLGVHRRACSAAPTPGGTVNMPNRKPPIGGK